MNRDVTKRAQFRVFPNSHCHPSYQSLSQLSPGMNLTISEMLQIRHLAGS
jgi:hypothetical protein